MDNHSGITPLGHRLVVLPDSVEQTTSSGIVLVRETTGRDEMKQTFGTVIAVGATCWLDQKVPNWCAPGDRIMFGTYAGNKFIGQDGLSYRLVNDLDVIGLENAQNV